MSPLQAAGSLLSRPRIPYTAITYLPATQYSAINYSTVQTAYRFLPPVLSAQFMTAPTGQASEIRNFAPAAPPRPVANNNIQLENSE